MKRIITLMVAGAAGLAACGGGDHKMTNAEVLASWNEAELYYSFPYDGQQNLSLNTPLVLRFSEPVDAEKFTKESVELTCDSGICKDKGATLISWNEDKQFEFVDNNLGVVLTPSEKLDANSKYCAELVDVPTASGEKVVNKRFCFNTAIAATHRGSLVELGVGDSLSIKKMYPDLNKVSENPIMDFSSYRFQFNEPLNSSVVRYGEHVKLLDAQQQLVENVTVLANHNTMTVHPSELLEPGQEYQLVFHNLPALHGQNDEGTPKVFSKTFALTPQSSEPRTILVQDTVKPSDIANFPCSLENNPKTSVLTGQALNCVPLDSVILGDKDASMQQGDLLAELAYIPNYPNITPLRVPRGSVLSGSNIKVRIAGNVPAAADDSMDTGEISVTVLSDAIGYIYPNPYSSAPDAPKQIKLYMDVAMTAENSVPNVVLSQDVMHIELNGMASLDGKSMRVDALGVVEPDILGAEKAFGFLSFQMKSYVPSEHQKVFDEAAKKVAEAPQFSSIYPHVDEGLQPDAGETISFLPSDALAINFDKPLDISTLRYGHTFWLEEGDVKMAAADVEWYLDGASLVIKHRNSYQSQTTYTVKLTDQITGLPSSTVVEQQGENLGAVRRFFAREAAGEPIAPLTYSFTTHQFDDANLEYAGDLGSTYAPKLFKNPLLFATYPGYPCAAEWDENKDIGNCIGDKDRNGNEKMILKPQLVQSNRPIHLTFSKAIAPLAQGAFEVRDEDDNLIDGEIEQGDFDLFFTPNKPWEIGKKYYYVVNTDPNNCSSGFCGKNGQPLMTAPLAIEDGDEANAFTVGKMYFIGTENTNTVYQSLRNTPTLDTPAVMTYFKTSGDDGDKIFKQTRELIEAGAGVPNSARLEFAGASGLVNSGNLGCKGGKGDYCPEKAYLHLAGNLNAEILGAGKYTCLYEEEYRDKHCGEEGEDALVVGIYPTVIATGSADLFANLLLPELPVDTPLLLETATGVQLMRIKPS
ncbi:MAG TPA: Ig-like domain-containing protein, partial [Alcanivoracaceae bacterium]|nr:Ig-like domain-containing protein [Alcanivoracaceae bacterium]